MDRTIIGAVLAGGRGRRFGGQDKALLSLNDRPLHDWVISSLKPQVTSLCVVAPQTPSWSNIYKDLTFISDLDATDKPIGPAGALLSVLKTYSDKPDALIVTATIDAPFLPPDFVSKLSSEMRAGDSAILPLVNGRLQPAFGLWRSSVASEVAKCVEDNDYALHIIAERIGARVLELQDDRHGFFNINSPDDLEEAERVAKSMN